MATSLDHGGAERTMPSQDLQISSPIGLIAAGGVLPFAVADSLLARDISPILVALKGVCDPAQVTRFCRSEERRVGKECRSRCDWSSAVCSSDLVLPFAVADSLLARDISPILFALKGVCDPAQVTRFC